MMIIPVILSGGSGTRLWPMSRKEFPKQFLALTGAQTMIQLTALRAREERGFASPMIVANAQHLSIVQDQLAAIGVNPAAIVLEPLGRNTAPAIALAALSAADPADMLLVMPSDHVITDEAAFLSAVAAARPMVEDGWLVTFGIRPTGPETGYGWIKAGEALAEGIYKVESFIEKPPLAKAQAMLTSGDHAWNSGIFLFRADAYLTALTRFEPEMLAACQTALEHARRSGNVIHVDQDAFAASPSNSIDYAVMERSDRVAMVPVSMGWSDVGSWDAVHSISPCDATGNVSSAGTLLIESENCLVRSDGARISLVGVNDLIVVASGDEILIMPRGRSQEARRAANARIS